METTEKLVRKYLNFSGERTKNDFLKFIAEVNSALQKAKGTDLIKLNHIREKLFVGLTHSINYETVLVIVDETFEDFERLGTATEIKRTAKTKRKPATSPKRKPKSLGKIVDNGETPDGRSDQYWQKPNALKVIFEPDNKELRSGQTIPSTYHYDSIKFLIDYYGLKGIEFGNWTSQQDRKNYLAGLGLALFDLKHAIGFESKEIGLKSKITVAFGARGRGSAVAHFEPDTFAINLTRYKRPPKVANRKSGFHRVELLAKGGGIGSFAHEYGHALDYFCWTFIHRQTSGALTQGRSTRTEPDEELMKENSLEGLMEKLLFKIIWDKGGQKHSPYYQRVLKMAGKGKRGKYWKQRNEIFARAFEVYVHYKMERKKTKNIFLTETKYDPSVYLTLDEMRSIEKDFDLLINSMKKKI